MDGYNYNLLFYFLNELQEALQQPLTQQQQQLRDEDVQIDDDHTDHQTVVDDRHPNEDVDSSDDTIKFDPLMWATGNYYANEPLFTGAQYSVLAFVFMLFELKTKFKSSFPDTLLLELLLIFRKILPTGNKVPVQKSARSQPSVVLFYDIAESFSVVKKDEIDICKNGCVAFINEYGLRLACPTCGTKRFKSCKIRK
jgi:hypothetical protein